jgi:hypothetical protein
LWVKRWSPNTTARWLGRYLACLEKRLPIFTATSLIHSK